MSQQLVVVPYIKTIGSERFKDFLTVPFKIDMLSPVSLKSCDTIFDGWQGKDMGNWHKFINNDNTILEFYPDYYIVKKPVGKIKLVLYQLPLPRTINDFVNDMDRFDIPIYWTKWIDTNFDPKDYLDKNEIQKYYTELLVKIGKIQEL